MDTDLNKSNVKDISEITGVNIHKLAAGWCYGVTIVFITTNSVGCTSDTVIMFERKKSLSVRDF